MQRVEQNSGVVVQKVGKTYKLVKQNPSLENVISTLETWISV